MCLKDWGRSNSQTPLCGPGRKKRTCRPDIERAAGHSRNGKNCTIRAKNTPN
jgi:hypothetical protein